MLRLSGLCKRFEDLPVLSNLSLTLSRGEIVALIGPSGCGKTTLLNIISGLTAPDAGTVEGADGRLSYMFQSARLLPWRTVEENIRLVREEAPAEEEETAGENEYIGVGTSEIGGEIKVKVTMDGDKIAKIEVLSHNETAGISDAAFEQIPEAIIAAQSTSVDAVSGATKTSEALIAAVNDALSQIK